MLKFLNGLLLTGQMAADGKELKTREGFPNEKPADFAAEIQRAIESPR